MGGEVAKRVGREQAMDNPGTEFFVESDGGRASSSYGKMKLWLRHTAGDTANRPSFPDWLAARRGDNKVAKARKEKEPWPGVEKAQCWLWDYMMSGSKTFNVYRVVAQKERIDAWRAQNAQPGASNVEQQPVSSSSEEEEEEEEQEQEQGEEQGEVAEEEEEEEEEEQQQQPEQPEQAQASSTPSSTTAEDTHTGGDEFARVLFEASEDPDLKRKADQLASGFDELKRDLANKKQKQTAAHAAKKELTELREKITNNTWEVTDCTRTNAEQQKCTVPLLDWLMAREVYKTHDVKVELVIQSPNKSKRLKVDVALIARNKTTDNDIRIECKLKKFTEARGQCAFYHDWDVRPGVWTYVYSYFPEKPCDDVIQGFEIDSTFVLWPGGEEMIRLRG
jgi:hypothetical protein